MDSLFFDTYEATSTYFLNTLKRAQQECTTYNSAAMVSKNKMLKNISEKAKCVRQFQGNANNSRSTL
jgi:hypothetical protein